MLFDTKIPLFAYIEWANKFIRVNREMMIKVGIKNNLGLK